MPAESEYIAFTGALRQLYIEELGRDPFLSGDHHAMSSYVFHWRENGATLDDVRFAIRTEPNGEWLGRRAGTPFRGNFLYPAEFFFGPAAAARPAAWQDAYFAALRVRGHLHVLINLQQDDWDPPFTAGGVNGFLPAGRAQVIDCLLRARRHGLAPIVGVFDQQVLPGHFAGDKDALDAAIRAAVPHVNPHAAAYWVTWEANEFLGDADQHRFARAVVEASAATGHPHAAGMHFGQDIWAGAADNLDYWRASPCMVLFMQYRMDSTTTSLRTRSQFIADRLGSIGKLLIAAEHSFPHGVPLDLPKYTEEEARARDAACRAGGAWGGLNG